MRPTPSGRAPAAAVGLAGRAQRPVSDVHGSCAIGGITAEGPGVAAAEHARDGLERGA